MCGCFQRVGNFVIAPSAYNTAGNIAASAAMAEEGGHLASGHICIMACAASPHTNLYCSVRQHSRCVSLHAAVFSNFSTTFRSMLGTVCTTLIQARIAWRCHLRTNTDLTIPLTTVFTAFRCSLVRSGTFTTGAGTYGMFRPEHIAAVSFCRKYTCVVFVDARAV